MRKRKIILTERQFSELILSESKHFPSFLKQLMLDVAEFTKKCIIFNIENNIVERDFYFSPQNCEYTDIIILKIKVIESENIDLNEDEIEVEETDAAETDLFLDEEVELEEDAEEVVDIDEEAMIEEFEQLDAEAETESEEDATEEKGE